MKVPYNKTSDTSREAAKAKRATVASDEARVFDFIRRQGDYGATDDEVELALGLLHQNASARRNRLFHAGKVKDSGMRRITSAGKEAIVWILGADEERAKCPTPKRGPRRPSDEQIRDAVYLIEARVGGLPRKTTEVLNWLLEITKKGAA